MSANYHMRCKLVHQIINFRSWCALKFCSKWSIIYFCALNYRVQKKEKKLEYDFDPPPCLFKPTMSKNYIHQVISWLKLSDSSIQTFSKVDKMIYNSIFFTCVASFWPKTLFKVLKMLSSSHRVETKVACIKGDVIKNCALCCSRPVKFKLIIFGIIFDI